MKEVKQKSVRPLVVVFCLVILVVVVVVIFCAYGWFLKRQKLVLEGFAHPTFPYNNYSVEELGKMHPQYLNVDVATTRTPEETHKMFMDKLKIGDLSGAVECCVAPGSRGEIMEMLNGVKARRQWDLMLGDIGVIRKESLLDTLATYSYIKEYNGEKYASGISFVKDSQGVWLIKSF